ncbi:hypothetical protein DL96DRAFT_1614044 [Flagelloscypha sp. PMI_526]|nr:hypothetical protein DL96DRAFT_1614044 [Flagelloscypha sp. PMI_526]
MPSTLLPSLVDRQLVEWAPSTSLSVEKVSLSVADTLHTATSTSTHLSPFFERNWLEDALKRVSWTLKGLPTAYKSVGVQHVPEHLERVQGVLTDMLALPQMFPPPVSADVLFEIFRYTVVIHDNPLSLTLVSSMVQRWVDPIIFRSCQFFYHDNNDFPSLPLQSTKLSPRFCLAAPFMSSITTGSNVPPTLLEIIGTHFPSLSHLSIDMTDTKIIPIAVPSLTHLHASDIAVFGDPKTEIIIIDNPLFCGVTSLSLTLRWCRPKEFRAWNWARLANLINLTDLIITVGATSSENLAQSLVVVKDMMIPALPNCLQLFGLRAYSEYGWQYYNWSNVSPDFAEVAGGVWDARTVMMLSVSDDFDYPSDWEDSVLCNCFHEDEPMSEWYREEAISIVRSRF